MTRDESTRPQGMAQAPALHEDSPYPVGGKYYGLKMRDVPAWYLDLCVDWRSVRENHPEVIEYVERKRKEEGTTDEHR